MGTRRRNEPQGIHVIGTDKVQNAQAQGRLGWGSPSPEQEQIIALTAAVSSLKTKAGKYAKDKMGNQKKDLADIGKGIRKNDGDFAWKDLAPKAGDPTMKVVKDRNYHWCTRHKHPQWSLHNPDEMSNLCKFHPNYNTLVAEWKAKNAGTDGGKKGDDTVDDIKLQKASMGIQESDLEDKEDDELGTRQTHKWVRPITIWGLALTAKITPGMIVLLMMPIVIEIITKGAALRVLFAAITYLLGAILADGEMCALTWIPMITWWILSCHDGPRTMPPKQDEYIPKKRRFEKCNWIMSNIPISWRTSINTAVMDARQCTTSRSTL
jgi:hypothetical protein